MLCTVFNTALSADPSDSTVSEDAGIAGSYPGQLRVATTALTVRRSNHSAKSHAFLPYLQFLTISMNLLLQLQYIIEIISM